MFDNFRKSLSSQTYRIILHIAGHGYEQNGNLILELSEGTKVYMNEFLASLNLQLDEIISQRSESKEDPVHNVAILVLWDACRESPSFPIPRRHRIRKLFRERQQALIHSCMTGSQGYDGCANSKNSPFILALMDLLGINTPFNVFELAMHLNTKVKDATHGKQSVEISCEATQIHRMNDWFVDLKKCNQLGMLQVHWKKLEAEIDDPKACARLVSFWDCQQQLFVDLAADALERVKAQTVDFERQEAETKRSLQEALKQKAKTQRSLQEALKRVEDAERRAQKAEETSKKQIRSVAVQLVDCLENGPGQSALRHFWRQLVEKQPAIDEACPDVREALPKSILRDLENNHLQPPCARTWKIHRERTSILCEGSKHFDCRVYVTSSSVGFCCDCSNHSMCFACCEKSIARATQNQCNAGKLLLTICGTAIVAAFLVFIFLCPACTTKYVEVPVKVPVKTPPESNPLGAIALFGLGVMTR